MDRPSRSIAARTALSATAACVVWFLTGCAAVSNLVAVATTPPAPAPAHLTGTPVPAAPGASAPVVTLASAAPVAATPPLPPGSPPHFANVIKDARKTEGLFTLWQKDEKVWIELRPEDFNKPFFLSPKFASGIGEGGLFGGTMTRSWGEAYGKPQVVEFRRIHNQVQMIARNTAFVAKAGSAEALAVKAAFSPSLLGSSPVVSQPHPEHKSVLIEANGLFVSDMLGVGMLLQRNFHQGYGFDPRHSAITALRGKADEVVFEVMNHYATSSIASSSGGGSGAPVVPGGLPDARSLFVNLHYSLGRLPEEPMAPRKADPRIGHFTTNVNDFGDDLARSPRVRYVNRWRLEKKDPAAALSEPVKPITFWLDRTIPPKYREAITAGVLEWNKAFERIGFKNALVVQVQPENADFDTLDMGYASIRWMTNSNPQFGAIGPSHVDPRSGEILDADIGIESLSSRSIRSVRAQVLGKALMSAWPGLLENGGAVAAHAHDPLQCSYAQHAGEQMDYALDVLEARGDLAPDGPQAQQFVFDYLKDTTMHEVGHTLGLRHNFRASTAYTEAQLSDPQFTRANGNTGSVMEYAPINLPRPGDKGGTPFQTTLGPYDYWAVEYAYKPFAPGTTPEQVQAELARIGARSREPQLAYATDEDNFLGVDPDAVQFDLGSDVLAFARKRIDIARDLLKRQEARELKPTEDYSVLRRSVSYALRDVSRAAGALARQIGGVRTLRDFPGSGRDPLTPVPASQQREALDLLIRGLLSADSFRISPALARRLAPDFQERTDAVFEGDAMASVQTDFSLDGMVLSLQRALLGQLMSDTVISRIVDSEGKSRPGEAFHVSELYGRLNAEVWSELAARKGDIPPLRRELQRDHVNRLASLVLRPSAYSRSDARSLLRSEAQALLTRINAATKRPGLSVEAKAHLADSAETLSQALAAKLVRAGV
ncbi:zinc-dependent metalloprotease [Ideonella sp. BN130291]|uniref:zinc-dependent metalloprotease n=1 Tax=Ideonella sp. BN130291 TaxID=3112940 RepID=UPI002E265FF4|nr:zinc-dependent metalloprotease [Ideonella sp. BN130291]